jgi:hypothetical protein
MAAQGTRSRPADGLTTVDPTDQIELPLFKVARENRSVQCLINTLDGRGWMTCSQILRLWFMPPTEANKRWVRALAEAAGDDVLSGQAGYKLVKAGTAEEVYRASSWLISQGKKMISRGIAIRRRSIAYQVDVAR